ncbi:MAG: hypothetical protein KIT84_04000 [Labilithrix sp.]|nr:hypothetical protein [Labilithrix sp.]MCW5810148.1 hypothetical protein [Labilithrix sp.]
MEGDERQPEDASARPSLSLGRGPTHNWRVLFAIAWIGVQLTLIVTAGRRPDGAFGFRMFSESSVMTLVLYREVDGKRVHVADGVWGAKSIDGRVHRFSWFDRVPRGWVFDREMPASYGATAQLVRLQAALDDVAAHVPDDAETTRFLLDVTMRRNGREAVVHHLTSRERIATTHDEVH